MKTTILTGVAAVVLGVGALVAAENKPTTKPSTQPATPINKNCAVNQDEKIDPKGKTYLYKGKVIGFCCESCIDDFKKDPEKYMKTIQ